MTVTKITLKAEVSSRVDANKFLVESGDAVLITRGTPRWLLLRCPCGCAEEIPVNLDPRAGKAWRFYRSATTDLSLFPSVWRDTGCQSHFIIWRNAIFMLGAGDYHFYDGIRFDIDRLCNRVLNAWPETGFASFVSIADVLEEIPWDVKNACRKLVENGHLVEAELDRRGWYRRA